MNVKGVFSLAVCACVCALMGVSYFASEGLAGPVGEDGRQRAADAEDPRGGGGGREAMYDLRISALWNMHQLRRQGTYPDGMIGATFSTEGCNVGDTEIPWYAPMDERHPLISQHFYRVDPDGRLEQLAVAWVKHAWWALNEVGCAFTCEPSGSGEILGVGCTDIYGFGTNGSSWYLGPRNEVNAHTGRWTAWCSFFDDPTGSGNCNGQRNWTTGGTAEIQRLLYLSDKELSGVFDGAQFYIEGYYVNQKEIDKSDIIAWRRVAPIWNDTFWTFTNSQPGHVFGPLVTTWGDVQSIAQPESEGQIHVASRAVDVGDGVWRYEYNVFNFDHAKDASALRVPFPGVSKVPEQFGFHQPRMDEPHSTDPWAASIGGGFISFETDPYSVDELANSIRWGTMYTFWFEADMSPSGGVRSARVETFKPGGEPVLLADVVAPRHPADWNDDGVIDSDDLLQFLADWAAGDADYNGDGVTDSDDLLEFLSDWSNP